MGTYSTGYVAAAALFVATILVVRIKADANHPESETISISPSSQNISPTSSTIVDIEPLSPKIFNTKIPAILSPDVFSEPDPLTYILAKITNNAYNGRQEAFAFINTDLITVSHSVEYLWKARKFPRPYVPYAKLLSSLVACLVQLRKVSTFIREIHQKYSANSNYPAAPSDISTPELRDLLSTDIFSDPSIPSVLLKKLLRISEDRIYDLKKDLTNLILCQKTETTEDSTNPNLEHENLIPASPNVDPLPSHIFKKPLTDLLSPDMFSQPDLLDYFSAKATKISDDRLRLIGYEVKHYLGTKQFPQPYIPYAKVLSSLLPCFVELGNVKLAINGIQTSKWFSYALLSSDIPPPDTRFSTLFSSDIFKDDKPPSVVLRKLLDIPESQMAALRIWLKNLAFARGTFTQYYSWYIRCLMNFFDYKNGKFHIVGLQNSIAEMQSIIPALN
ncbi:hypothetical protein U1Q18_044370 [Sarracenia purpurea var. burkii]